MRSKIPAIRILISYVTAGTGHARAAEAVAEAVRRRLPHAQVFVADLLTFSPGWLRWAYPRLYALLVRHLPSFWALVYYAFDQRWIFWALQPVRRRWNWLVAKRFLSWVKMDQPDVVVVTHFFPADVLAAAKQAGWLRSRLVVVVTDLFPHRFWLMPEADAFVVGTSQTKAVCQKRGIGEDRLHVLGIPIGSKFRVPACAERSEAGRADDRAAVSRKLGLDPSNQTVLIVSGGMGVGPIHRLTRRLIIVEATRPNRLQLLVVCGHNRQLRERLERVSASSPMPVRVFGFVETMDELMRASDLMVTKAGGLTVMEALALGLPMVFCGTIPGQEHLNAEYAVSHGAGLIAQDTEEVLDTVLRLLDDPTRLQAMRAQAIALGKPQAAQDLIERLIVPCEHG